LPRRHHLSLKVSSLEEVVGRFFGFELHVLVRETGVVLAVILTPGDWADQDVARALAQSVAGGIAWADLGYQGQELFESVGEEADLWLVTPASAPKGSPERILISSIRERVETTFSGLWSPLRGPGGFPLLGRIVAHAQAENAPLQSRPRRAPSGLIIPRL
jgi:hypothetical protein